MEARLERQLSDLLTCPVDSAGDVYEQVLDVFQQRVKVGVMTFFRGAEAGGEVCYDDMRYRGDTDAKKLLGALDGQPLLEAPTLDVQCPEGEEINGFIHHDADTPLFRESQIYDELLAPLTIHSASRILVYSGDRFVGWVGCFRRGDQPRCDGSLCRDLEPLTDPLCAALSAADQIHRQRLPDGQGFATFDPAGRLQYASEMARCFLDDGRRKTVAHSVKRLDGGDVAHCVQVFDGVEVRITRMEGGGVYRYLAQLVPATPATLDSLAKLTPSQREVCEYAATGATNAEIAEATDRSPQTVKTHIRNAYDRLGICSRVELAALVDLARAHRLR